MEKPKTLITLSFLLILVSPYLQTGFIDVNRQLGNLETVNQQSNTLCYTEIFPKEFQALPKVATALAEFDTSSEFNYQLEIRIRKVQLTRTNAKFMIFARSEISIWNRIVFSYLATDNEDISASTAVLNTQDLSGCGAILAQQFRINLQKKYEHLHGAIFLNGMDVSVVELEKTYSDFEVSLVITQKFQNQLKVEVRRASPTQIYSVSVGYVALDPKSSSDSFEFVEKTFIFDEILKSQPFVEERKHGLDLNNAPFFVGIQKFTFCTDQKSKIKSLALSLHEDSLLLGSLDSTNLKYTQISFMVFKEKVQCKENEIIVRNEEKGNLQCKICQSDENRVPNDEQDTCVCKNGFYEIEKRCYELPIGAKWNIKKKTFVCNGQLAMIYSKKEDSYKCKTIPKNKMWDSVKQKWQCVDEYYEIKDQCLPLPDHSYYQRKEKKFVCLPGYFEVEGTCGKSYQNEEWSHSLRRFLCSPGYHRIGNVCLRPYKNSFFDQITKKFICKGGFYMEYPGICEELPANMKFNYQTQKLTCKQNYYEIEEVGGCFEKPDNMQYDKIVKKFICQTGHFPYQGYCRQPKQNEEWSVQLSHFVCKKGTFRIKKQFCLPPKPNSHYSTISQDFECDEGYYNVNSQCLQPPKNMKYEAGRKIFICNSEYEEIDEECVKIPINKKWVKQIRKFACIENYYEIEDESCKKLAENEQYIAKERRIVCLNNFFKLKGKCKQLPKHAIFVEEKQDFSCQSTYYRNNDLCESCSSTCLHCEDSSSCEKCIQGYEKDQNGKCVQICGDGKRFELACDDGNTDNEDGCSGDCEVEQGWNCKGGNPSEADVCTENSEEESKESFIDYMEIKMVGMSHLYGKIILNIKIDHVPEKMLQNQRDMKNIFRVLTNSQIPLKVSSVYIDTTKYTFVVLYDFNKYEPIPEYLTRIEIDPEMKEKYMKDMTVKPLFIRINPAFMALKDSKNGKQDSL